MLSRNQPYGDQMMLLRALSYRVHPYRWATIGLSPDHIADLGVMALMLVTIVALAYLFHLPFEAQTYRVRRYLKSALAWPRPQPGAHSGLA